MKCRNTDHPLVGLRGSITREQFYPEIKHSLGKIGWTGEIIDICDSGTLCVKFDSIIFPHDHTNHKGCGHRGSVMYCAYVKQDFFMLHIKKAMVTCDQFLREYIHIKKGLDEVKQQVVPLTGYDRRLLLLL